MIPYEHRPNIVSTKPIIDPDLIYIVVGGNYFFIYNFETETWKDLKTDLTIKQRIEDSFLYDGTLYLPLPENKPVNGVWFYCEDMDMVLDFYNNKGYEKYL